MVFWIWEAFELFTDREALLSANEWFIFVDLQCLLMQVLQLEYLMIIFCLYQTLNSIGFPLWVHFYNIPPITDSIIIDFFLLTKHFDHLKYTIEINIILAIHKSYSCLIYTWDQGYMHWAFIFISESYSSFFLVDFVIFFLNCK